MRTWNVFFLVLDQVKNINERRGDQSKQSNRPLSIRLYNLSTLFYTQGLALCDFCS